MTNVAFIGLGTMGLPMAQNILNAGHPVVGYDTAANAIAAHIANGGAAANSPAHAAEGAEIVITMLPVGSIVKSALLDDSGVTQTIDTSALIIDMSTIDPLDTDDIREGLKQKSIHMIDAPVGRTSKHARTGNLLIMAGGEPTDIEKARPVLECMGDTIIDCGGPGMGSRMKVINNLMSIVLNVLTAEVLTLAESTGLDRNLAIEVMSGTAAGLGHMSTTYPAKVLQDDLTADFMIDLAKKDLGIALSVSKQTGVPLALAEEAQAVYADAQADGRGTQDWTAVYAMLKEKYLQ